MKHVLDHRTSGSDLRSRAFMAIDKMLGKEGTHPATQALLKRPKLADGGNSRLRQFLRIARGGKS